MNTLACDSAITSERFATRAATIRGLGFSYRYVQEYNIGMFARPRLGGGMQYISADFVSYVDDAGWADYLAII
jgi:hypothetical protein